MPSVRIMAALALLVGLVACGGRHPTDEEVDHANRTAGLYCANYPEYSDQRLRCVQDMTGVFLRDATGIDYRWDGDHWTAED